MRVLAQAPARGPRATLKMLHFRSSPAISAPALRLPRTSLTYPCPPRLPNCRRLQPLARRCAFSRAGAC
ncbi:uncharacterized protein SCHCODRAFT_02608985 [Schizophyllum commune H4-8]|uniref:uncharacterized protein n=1 Tax=Schizophyllum commune (strain H4-8 / FGSC 9210) TaxID=578458 RepID=UPI002160F6D8|nr:uncharacterized protein SCHCODRAFT_02608985 [Schizophyllum commune H4-8]KAI5897294.1 hypothetical protein SCHCODRAFT_02608985 [Schizophyllum commune H4-8]